ncbi:MAG: hypothetical protein WCP03_02575 [Candidatus Saccharibacteria bacterium]
MDQQPLAQGPESPRPEHISPNIKGGERVVPTPEKAGLPASGEFLRQAGNAVSQSQIAAQNTAAYSAAMQPPVSDNATHTDATNSPIIADDVDVIEKEWVQKAKEIVTQTKDDPHKQSVELTKFKHDYMNKRYGKDIKLPDEQAA